MMLRSFLRSPRNVRLFSTSQMQNVVALDGDRMILPANSNQARGIAEFAIDFMAGKYGNPDPEVLERVEMFHTDSVLCGLSALALQCNSPHVLRNEAFTYPKEGGATVFGSMARVAPEKACVANCNAVREWDSNGTVFGFNEDKSLGKAHQAGEFGHNDFYPVSVAAGQMKNLPGDVVLRSMLLSDEIRGRLAEVFSLKSYKIDHVVHGAIASAATFGAMMGASVDQIESAIGMCVAHYVPFRAIRAGKQLSDSKGASAAISTEAALVAMQRAMNGFIGPADIFRNPESIFRLNEPTNGDSPFNIILSHSGRDFAVMGMHFKLGLYEHQSAGAIQALLDAIQKSPNMLSSVDNLKKISIEIYEPAFGIIGDPAKRTPTTRQSADHSMVYIISSILKKAFDLGPDAIAACGSDNNEVWKKLMLLPHDYGREALYDPTTRKIFDAIEFIHGGQVYDDKYPEGIPTTLTLECGGEKHSSDLVMFPGGHARNTANDLKGILAHKWKEMGALCVEDVDGLMAKLSNLQSKSADEIQNIYMCDIINGPQID